MKTKPQLINLGLTSEQADKVMNLEHEMTKRAVVFVFVKKDGTKRHAVGTLDRARMIEKDGHMWEPKGVERGKEQDHLLKFWDCIEQAWRCCNVSNILSVEE